MTRKTGSGSHASLPEARIDRWLWAARLFKTRNQATQACRNGRVRMGGEKTRPSRTVRPGDIVELSRPPVIRRFRVIQPAVKRVSAKKARQLVEEITPVEELERLRRFHRDPLAEILAYRSKGSGRPTKKERRELEKWRSENEDSF